jgi:hypothetical protein
VRRGLEASNQQPPTSNSYSSCLPAHTRAPSIFDDTFHQPKSWLESIGARFHNWEIDEEWWPAEQKAKSKVLSRS